MRPVNVMSENNKDATAGSMQQQQQQQQQQQHASSTASGNGAAFSLTRRVGARGGPQLFAHKLFTLVEEEDSDIVEWLPDGLAFRVKDIHRFSCEVLEKYFNHSKFTSFQRQLNLYQFKRRKGAHAGAFHHPSFRRGQRHLLSKVRRQKVKRDLAVQARAAERLERAKNGTPVGEASGNFPASQHRLSGRGRTRTAVQADLRPPSRPHRKVKSDEDDDDDEYVTDDEEEFDGPESPGSRRSALRQRVDEGPAACVGGIGGIGIDARYAQDMNGGDESSSNDDTWPADSSPGSGLEQTSSGDDDERMDWGGAYNNNNWRQQVPGSPDRSPGQLHHVSTPMTMTSPSDYEVSPSSGTIGALDRTSSVSSSMASSVSFASSPCHSDTMFHSGSPYQFKDYDESDSASPMSVHSAVGQAVASVQAAAVAAVKTQVSPVQQQQRQQQDIDLSFSAVVDASINGWGSPHQSSSLPRLENFGWGAASVASAGEPAGAPSWSADAQSSSGVPQHHQSSQPTSPPEDFGFIDLFAANWDAASEGVTQLPSSPIDTAGVLSSCSSSSAGGNSSENVGANDAFLKQAQTAGVFFEDLLVPNGGNTGNNSSTGAGSVGATVSFGTGLI